MGIELGNLTLITNGNICNKNCPFCIAKSAGKVYNKTIGCKNEFQNLKNILQNFENNDIRFNRLVISGNGEPSFYKEEELIQIINSIEEHINIFNGIRIHTSGNIFYDKKKFELFNKISNIEFNILRIAFDSKTDMEILGYNKDYTKTNLFKSANNIKLDIALTNILEYSEFFNKITEYTKKYPNIRNIRIKELLCGKEDSEQTRWIKEHKLEKEKIDIIKRDILRHYKFKCNLGEKIVYENEKNNLIYGASGEYKYYNKDFIISNNRLMNYDEKEITIEKIKEIFKSTI